MAIQNISWQTSVSRGEASVLTTFSHLQMHQPFEGQQRNEISATQTRGPNHEAQHSQAAALAAKNGGREHGRHGGCGAAGNAVADDQPPYAVRTPVQCDKVASHSRRKQKALQCSGTQATIRYKDFVIAPEEPCRYRSGIQQRRVTAGETVAPVQILQVNVRKCPSCRRLPKGARPLLADTRQHRQPARQCTCPSSVSSAVAIGHASEDPQGSRPVRWREGEGSSAIPFVERHRSKYAC